MSKYIFSIFFMILFMSGGCASVEYSVVTKQEELVLISDEKEIKIGRSIAAKIEKQFEFSQDKALKEKVDCIGNKVAQVCDRTQIPYHFEIIEKQKTVDGKTPEEEKPNAFAIPGGYVYVNKAIFELIENDDELAGVLAHEVGHIVAKHSIKRLQAIYGYSLLRVFSAVAGSQVGWDSKIDRAIAELFLSYSREDELLADKLAVKYTALAGYKPEAMITFLEKLREFNMKEPIRRISFARTHPYMTERIKAVKQEVRGEIEFTDFINVSP